MVCENSLRSTGSNSDICLLYHATFFCPSLSTVYSQDELEDLHKFAVKYVKRRGGNYFGKHACKIFYRNKSPQYFDQCQKKDNIMKMYLKDNNGDPRSPINGRIKGLFFATGVDQDTGQPTNWSHFGAKRVSIPSKTMLMTNSNLYFADFYCKCDSKAHYVTLVLTKPGSKTDGFCEKNLISVDIGNNDFLYHSSENEVRVTNKVWVEVFYTEDVDLSSLEIPMKRVTVRGRGSSKPGGLPKDSRCRVCNLHVVSDEDTDGDDIYYDGDDIDYDGGDVDYDGGDVDYDGGDVDYDGGDVDYDGGDVDYDGGDVDYDGGDVDYDGGDVDHDVGDVDYDVGDVDHDVGDVDHDVGDVDHDVGDVDYDVGDVDHDVGDVDHDVGDVDHDVGDVDHDVGDVDHDVGDVDYDVGNVDYDVGDVDYNGHDVGYEGDDVGYDGDYDIDDLTEQFGSGWND